ncbi:MAG: hypothetical protein ABIV94_10805 [Acidimicrobiales bacterium]
MTAEVVSPPYESGVFGVRRHVRGGWYAGDEPATASDADFVKNAAR